MATKTRKPNPVQFRLIVAILERGGTDVSGNALFAYRNGITAKSSTLAACQRHGWIKREERDGVAYWSVTLNGRDDAERVNHAAVETAAVRGRLRMPPLIRGTV